MNTMESNTALARCRCIFGSAFAATLLLCATPFGTAGVSAQSSLEQWQLRRLNEPTERERRHEREGNVYIYEGLTDRVVDQVLSTHFDRIEYMMFLGTLKTEPTGEVRSDLNGQTEAESPDCSN